MKTKDAIPSTFHVMTKPTGPLCNLDCTYCFYLEKEKLYPDQTDWHMPDEVLESYVRQYIQDQGAPEVTFAWQGGEPTLLGIDYFRRVVALQQEHAHGKRVHNAFQTNGVLLNDEWAAFLAEHQFLVGISIDGPEKMHNRYRVDRGHRSTFSKVMRGVEFLQKHSVEFNTLTVVNDDNSCHPLQVYHFLKEIGSGFIQFIPVTERQIDDDGTVEQSLVLPDSNDLTASVTPWSVDPLQYGEFLVTIFDEWVRNDVGRIYVQLFDIALEAWTGRNPSLCIFSETCGLALAMEHNGDIYSCDHYVYPEYRLGNLMNKSLSEMVCSSQQAKFGDDKRDALPKYCQECEVRFACNGDCPKHRFAITPDGDPGLSFLCPSYKRFFTHASPFMEFMSNELREKRPPANIMRQVRAQDLQTSGKTVPSPNDTCVCGSGRKYKKCCGRVA